MVTGFYKTASGNEYRGQFLDGLRHGNGVATFKNGGSYEGEYKHDMMHGHGKYYFACGSIFEGSYVNNQRSGFGTLTNKDGDIVLQGDFKDGNVVVTSSPSSPPPRKRNNSKVLPTQSSSDLDVDEERENTGKPGLEPVASRRVMQIS